MNLHAQPRFPLARLPTPLHEARRLREALGGERHCPRILLKRDDLTDLALGGNKARKLEFLVADALASGATMLITTGGVQSNHARMTAAAARLAGLEAALVLTSPTGEPEPQGNLLLDRLLGADIHFVSDTGPGGGADAEAAKIEEIAGACRSAGGLPYVVELGGSDAVGAIGYVHATFELVDQLRSAGERPTRLYHASGSRGTQAGLELGARLFDPTYRVIGIAVSPGGDRKQQRAVSIAAGSAERLGTDVRIDTADLLTDESYFGEGYAIPTATGIEAIRLLAQTEAILLDPVYTGKAMAGLIDHIRTGTMAADETVVFLHTGGVPGLFAQARALLVPETH